MHHLGFKCLPLGALPYVDKAVTTRMMVKLFENTPYLPLFPIADEHDNLAYRTLGNVPFIEIKDNEKIFLRNHSEGYDKFLAELDIAYNSSKEELLENFSIDFYFIEKYLQIVKKVKPKETIISLMGPFSIAHIVENDDKIPMMTEPNFRKFIIELIVLKSLWLINKIHAVSPQTVPFILLHETKLNLYGTIKRENESVTQETVVNFYSKIFEKIHEAGGAVGVHSVNKCDWQIPIEAGADLISFDAYNNPNNLNIIADKVRDFLTKGGYINWGMVPAESESVIKSAGIDNIFDRFMRTTEALIEERISPKLLYARSKVSVTGNLDHLPLIFAEKALILSTQLAQRIPRKF